MKIDEQQFLEKLKKIIQSQRDAFEKKIALFNLVKSLVVEEDPNEERKTNCLLMGKFYNTIALEKMKEYKKMVVEEYSTELANSNS